MDHIVEKLSEIDHAAEAVVAHAEVTKANLEQEIQQKRNEFDAALEAKTQKALDNIRAGLERQMTQIMTRQRHQNEAVMKHLEKDFDEKHTVYAAEVVQHILEG